MERKRGQGPIPTTFDGVLAAIVAGFLLFATFLTLKPFIPAILWAIVLAVSAAPLHGLIERKVGNRRRLAALITSVILVLILVVPAIGLTRGIIAYTPGLLAWVNAVSADSVTTAPQSIRNLPWVGDVLSRNWELIVGEGKSYIAHFRDDIEQWLVWGLQEVENVGLFVFEIALGVVLAGVFLAHRGRLSGFAETFFHRVGGSVGTTLLGRAVRTTRSTVRGVVGSAVAEALVATFAYLIAGVPAWLLLGGLTFFAALVQIGAPLVWIPVALWLLAENDPGWAIFVTLWGILVVYPVENLSRPVLAGRTAELPGLLIFVGVLGGLVAWGLIGVFLGPVILAVAYDLIQVWFRADPESGMREDGPSRGDTDEPSAAE
ncbi:MAG: AI-2E family transporter [Bauldia sp.]|uniref:AI-2E family transporter n=1 Tax=Bauldia sp. TaxID=2575872 RepID=UPI001D304953|nr:AI-2E family transporter [Bauldia sp.]MCB1496397.1 AI-2E family transporter [Bauldia sp.]